MLRFIATFLFLAVAVVPSIIAGDVFAAGENDDTVASILTTGVPGPHAAMSACAGGAAEKYHQDCCDGLFCGAATALAQSSGGSDALPVSDAIWPAVNRDMAGRNVAPETAPPKFIV